jgi:hypothetical protein
MEDIYTALLNHFEKELAEGKTEFRLVARQTERGVEMYIHPMGKDGNTIDLYLEKHQSTYVTFGKK